MGDDSKIEWTGRTWTPLTCMVADATGAETVTIRWDEFTAPLRRRKPTRYALTSMGDAFHPAVPDDFLDRLFAVMALATQHTFQILTKRPERMAAYLLDTNRGGLRLSTIECIDSEVWATKAGADDEHEIIVGGDRPRWRGRAYETGWPLPNVWLGTTVENQAMADERIPHLLNAPAAVRFLSCEPLLGPVRLVLSGLPGWDEDWKLDALTGHEWAGRGCDEDVPPVEPRIHWVICGGESGPKARPMHPDWARSLRDQCVEAGVPFFFKQWGEWAVTHQGTDTTSSRAATRGQLIEDHMGGYGAWLAIPTDDRPRFDVIERVGKKAAGRLLDGRTWDEVPAQGRPGT